MGHRSYARCGAQTRRGTRCLRRAWPNGRCPNHGGLSTGPKTPEGRQRIAAAQVARWRRWREERTGVLALRSQSFVSP